MLMVVVVVGGSVADSGGPRLIDGCFVVLTELNRFRALENRLFSLLLLLIS